MIANDHIFECDCVKRTSCLNPDSHKPHFLRDSLLQQLPIGPLKLSMGANPLSLSSGMQKFKRQVTSDRWWKLQLQGEESEVASTLSPSPTGLPDSPHSSLLSENLENKQQGPCLLLAKSEWPNRKLVPLIPYRIYTHSNPEATLVLPSRSCLCSCPGLFKESSPTTFQGDLSDSSNLSA